MNRKLATFFFVVFVVCVPVSHTYAEVTTPSPVLPPSILAQFASILLTFQSYLTHQQAAVVPQQVAAGGGGGFTAQSRIDNLSNTTIQNPTITGGSISGTSIIGSISNTINTALATIDNLTATNLTATNATTTSLTVTGTSTLNGISLSNTNCSSFGNGGKLTTDAFGMVVCAADQGGAGSTVAGSDTQVQFNDGGSFGANGSFIFNKLASRLTLVNASTTNLSVSGVAWLPSLANVLIATDPNGKLIATSTIGNSLLTGSGALTVTAGTGLSGGGAVSLGGSVSLSLNNTGDWAGTLSGNSAATLLASSFSTTSAVAWLNTKSTTNLTEGSGLYFTSTRADNRINATTSIGTLTSAPNLGTVATSLTGFLKAASGVLSTVAINLAADVTGILPVGNGGTGWANVAAGAIPYGNGGSALATTTAGTAGQVLALLNGVPTWTATTTFSAPLSYSAGAVSITQANGSTNGYLVSSDWSIFNGKLASTSLATSALLAGLISDETGSGSLAFGTSPTFAGTPVFSGGVVNYSVNSTTTIPSNSSYAYTIATSTTAAPLIRVDTASGTVSVGSVGSDVTIGDVGQPSNLVFEENSTIKGASTGRTITIGANSDIINFGVNVGFGTSTPGSLLSLNNIANFTTATTSFYSTGGINLTSGCFSVGGTCISGGGTSYTFSYPLLNSANTISLAYGTTTTNTWSNLQTLTNGFVSQASSTVVGAFTATGFINTSGTTGGYQQAGNTVLYASTTNSSLALGASAAATWMAATSTLTGNLAIGSGALATTPTNGVAGRNDTAVGLNALNANTTGYSNAALGVSALQSNTTGFENMGFGMQALTNNTIGADNVGIGYSALSGNITGDQNVGIGSYTLGHNQSATGTVAIGYLAGYGNGGNYANQGSVAIGYQAGQNFQTGSDYNTLLGWQAGTDITSGNNNLILGSQQTTGNSITTGSNNILLGQGVRVGLTQTGSNQLNIGNLIFGTGLGNNATISTGSVGIGTSTPRWTLTAASSTGPQLGLTDTTSGSNAWTFRNTGGTLYIATSTATATSSTSAFTLDTNGNLIIKGSAASCTIGNGTSATSCSSSDQRLKDDISSLAATSGLSAISALNPVSFYWNSWMQKMGNSTSTQFGLVAQQVQNVFPNLVQMNSSGYYTLDYQGLIAPIIKAIQELDQKYTDVAHAVAGFADRLTTHNLCVTKSDGTPVCITGDQLANVLSATASQTTSTDSSTLAPTGTSTPPVISINGNNPALLHTGDTYLDQGAIITAPQADLNLGIATFLNGIKTDTIHIDTSTTSTSTIDYVVTDQNGLTSTSTRTVIVNE